MIVPGSNLLNQAMRVIKPTPGVQLKVFTGEAENDYGATVPSYADAVPLRNCSVQPLAFRDIQVLGLTVGKRYITVWLLGQSKSAYRGGQADQILWNGSTWTVLEPTSWAVQDGWTQLVAVRES